MTKILVSYVTPWFTTVFRTCHWSLSDPVQSSSSHSVSLNLILILSFHYRLCLPNWSLHFRSSFQCFLYLHCFEMLRMA